MALVALGRRAIQVHLQDDRGGVSVQALTATGTAAPGIQHVTLG